MLTNGGSAPVWVLRWGTPLEDFSGDALRIVGPDGRVLEYQGPMVKRGDPGMQEYVRIEPNASTERVIDAASAYSFAAPGRYSVSFDRGLLDTLTGQGEIPRPRDRHRPIDLTCGPVEFEVGAG